MYVKDKQINGKPTAVITAGQLAAELNVSLRHIRRMDAMVLPIIANTR